MEKVIHADAEPAILTLDSARNAASVGTIFRQKQTLMTAVRLTRHLDLND